MICLFLFVLIVCSCTTPVSAVDSALGIASNRSTISYVSPEDEAWFNSNLTKSTFYSWDPSMSNYNCYSYVLGITTSPHDPGDFSISQVYNPTCTIDELVDVVKYDLYARGETCVRVQTTTPQYDSNKLIIATKKTEENTLPADYHFAKLTIDGWLHKPGNTAILKFKNAPSSTAWVCEGVSYLITNNQIYRIYNNDEDISYNTPVRYIIVSSTHTQGTTTAWTENHYHSGSSHFYEYGYTCSDCGDVCAFAYWRETYCNGNCILPWSTTPEHEVD